ncbi:MAG: HDIG domain-containing protein [Candidatus Lokiarchaeota archaeon]|nr:HDIG domain-containing protein [Candidatus Lokiarchaeota archaeon]MBD3340722.1 HDIG domain-containing protein [Candidatus Lokiarchaeota archaeon]
MVNKNLSANLPGKRYCIQLLKELKVPYSVRRHSIRVAQKALEIAKKINSADIDQNLVLAGALLHDIGRAKTHGFRHALWGGKILRKLGFCEELARICETHILGGLDKSDAKEVGLPDKDYLPTTIEEKIVCLADKHMSGSQEVSIDERFEKWFEKYGRSNILLKSRKRIKAIQKEIRSLIND